MAQIEEYEATLKELELAMDGELPEDVRLEHQRIHKKVATRLAIAREEEKLAMGQS